MTLARTRVVDCIGYPYIGPTPATGFRFCTGNNHEGLPFRSYGEHDIVNFYAVDTTGNLYPDRGGIGSEGHEHAILPFSTLGTQPSGINYL